ncbi:TNF receptor superfamily member 25 [Phyllostomus discolor]|uniref:TNF receptor superfamily member 25 n=1 Tax=Phyllostomus discolor TaxID=89673 RepID=A0A834AI78_9CHIR|nr:TNF receptor superfamily member 25 [Phyllostomus discolor]
MERQLGGRAAVLAAALLLLLLLLPPPGAGGQAGTPGPRCGCAHNPPKRSSLLCCRGCPAVSQVALRNCSAAAGTSCGCRPGSVMECLDAHCVGSLLFQCRSCLDCGALRRHPRVPCHPPLTLRQSPRPSGATQRQ